MKDNDVINLNLDPDNAELIAYIEDHIDNSPVLQKFLIVNTKGKQYEENDFTHFLQGVAMDLVGEPLGIQFWRTKEAEEDENLIIAEHNAKINGHSISTRLLKYITPQRKEQVLRKHKLIE